MVNNQENKTYTAADIQRYLRGEMSGSESNALEKAALKDPFLADAIEGYAAASPSMSIASSLQSIEPHQIAYTFSTIKAYLAQQLSFGEQYQIEKAAIRFPLLSDALEGFEQTNLSKAALILTKIEQQIETLATQTQVYNAHQLQAYLGGALGNVANLAIEKAALSNHLLQDAIDGYAIANKELTNNLLIATAEKIQVASEKQDTHTTVKISDSSKIWLRIAAILVVLLAVGTSIWLVNKEDKENVSIASNSSVNNDVTVSNQPTTTIPSAIPKSSEKQSANIIGADRKQHPTITDNLITTDIDDKSNANKPAREDNAKEIVASVETVDAIAFKKEEMKAAPTSLNKTLEGRMAGIMVQNNSNKFLSNEIKGRVTDNEGNGIGAVSLNFNKNNNNAVKNAPLVVTDNEGYFAIKSNDTALNAELNSVGYDKTIANISANKSNNIVLKPNVNNLSEVVVARRKVLAQKNENITPDNLVKYKSTTNTNLQVPAAYPLIGWDKYNEYLQEKIDSINDEEDLHGEVIIEFDVNNQGKPVNIVCVNKADPIPTQKAIDLVKDGPTWLNDKKNYRGRVVVRF